MTYEEAEQALLSKLTKETILGVSGVSELVTEEFQNDIIDIMNEE